MLKQFFILCSGADRDLLEGCSEGEQTKYVGIGATVFFTAVMAFLASAYALFTVFDSIYPASNAANYVGNYYCNCNFETTRN